MKIHLDFETRSELDIKKVGAWVYSTHPSTEVLCMAWAIDDNFIKLARKEKIGWYTQEFPKEALVIAHNAFFEYVIWHNILVERYGYSPIPLEQWRCTAAKASALALPRGLDNLAKAIDLQFKKDTEGKTMMMKMCKPRNPLKAEKEYYKNLGKPVPILWHEKPEDFEILHRYCMGDVAVERAADNKMRDLSPRELEVFISNMRLNLRGIKVDTQAVDNALEMITDYSLQLENEVSELTDGELDGLSRRQAALTWIKGEGVYLPDFTKETVNEVLNGELPPNVQRVLEIRQELGKTSLAKYKAFKIGTDSEGFIRDILIYHGAATGRDTGQRMQVHNLPRITIDNVGKAVRLLNEGDINKFQKSFPKPLQVLSQTLRTLLIARDGYKFVGADWNAIEVRILFWYAKETKGLHQYLIKEDLYKDMATKIFNININGVTKMQRFVGKQAVLGCGYGMGLNGERFIATCRQHGVNVPLELAQLAVRTYRDIYKKVVNYWRVIGLAVSDAIRTGKIVRVDKLTMFTHEDFLFIKLPSGRMLAYHKPLLEGNTISHMGWNSMSNKYERQKTWGGTLVENIVQGTARDVLVEGRKNVEQRGYKYVLSIHDELLTETQTGNATEFENILHVKPEWIADCPLRVEAWEGDRFGIK